MEHLRDRIAQAFASIRALPLTVQLLTGFVFFLGIASAAWVGLGPSPADRTPVRADLPVSTETTLLLRDVRRTMDHLQQLAREQDLGEVDCARCVVLTGLADHFEAELRTGIDVLRTLEHGQLAEGADDQQASPAALQQQRQLVANRLAALEQFSRAALQCGKERLCQRDDAQRETATTPFDCTRDRQALREAAARISALSQTVLIEARRCRRMTCPTMACDGASALVADLDVAEQSLAQLAGGQIALQQAALEPSSGGLAVIVGQLEGAIARLARDSARGARPAADLAADADRMGRGLQEWLDEREQLGALPRDGWRASALLAELTVAAERLEAEPAFAVSPESYDALAAALLDATRFRAAIASREDQQVLVDHPGPVCGVDELATAYLDVGRALSAIRFCRLKAACPAGQDGTGSSGQGRSASAPEISAFAAVTGALPLDPARSNIVRVTESPRPRLTTDRNRYQVGEVIAVHLDPEPSACLNQRGIVSLSRTLAQESHAQSYQVSGASETDLMFGATEQPGEYVVQVFGDAARGGVKLGETGLSIEPATPGCVGFSGLWETNFGRLRLVARGQRVTGSYRRTSDAPLPGIVLADIEGRTLTGTWMSELGRGGTRLRLSADGNRFTGTWGIRPDRHDGAGSWTGTCLGAAH